MPAYNSRIMDATQPCYADEDWHEHAFDLTRGIAVYCRSPLVKGLSRVIAKHPEADIGNAFNHKQVACKMWARDSLFERVGGVFGEIWIVGGWYGVLAAMLLDDPRFKIGLIENSDIDPAVGEIAETLNHAHEERFRAVTADMYRLDYVGRRPDLVVNTSCEHIPDIRSWLSLMPKGTRVLLQSNNYFAEPTHIACVACLDAFGELAGLSHIDFAGELPMKKYTRYMLIGRV
ncbi:class I SAM-dependent methyltransferase [Mesorhizobium sp. ASY16-5R]|uniref:class I SAM-dependent methyltransferase n=1 Tax=Mesorhizobium sp. ASY16-5R TaxID=3445772 RepID=UPI003FA0C284